MDLDDLLEDLLPKKQLKKLKKKFKKKSLWGLILAWIASFFFGRNEQSRRIERPDTTTSYKPIRQQTVVRRQPYEQETDDPLLASLAQARTYQKNIEAMALAAEPDSVERLRLDLLNDRVTEWMLMIEQIVEQALSYREDELLAAERKRVPEAIKRLEKQLSKAKEPTLRAKLEKTLANRRKQLAQLDQSSNNRQIAELKVENTLAQLGIIYSQLHSGRSVAERSGYERLSAEIGEEIHTLEDYLDAYQALHEE